MQLILRCLVTLYTDEQPGLEAENETSEILHLAHCSVRIGDVDAAKGIEESYLQIFKIWTGAEYRRSDGREN